MIQLGEEGFDITWTVGEIKGSARGTPLLVLESQSPMWAVKCLSLCPTKVQARTVTDVMDPSQNGFVVWLDKNILEPILSAEIDDSVLRFLAKTTSDWVFCLQWEASGQKYRRAWFVDGRGNAVVISHPEDPTDFVQEGWL